LRRLAIATCAVLALSAAGVQTQTFIPPSMATDEISYNAGDEVFLSGQNWPAGELVTLQISEDGNPGHVDTLYATTDPSGDVSAAYTVPGHGSVQNFTVTATSPSVGAPVTTGFTNAGSPATFSWDTSGWTTALPSTRPWVRTDQDDYQPGEVARIAGGGWTPGDFVTLAFTEIGPETFHPAVKLHAVADDIGLVYAGFVLQPHDLGEAYLLTATSGADAGVTAQTTFTDDLTAQLLPFTQDWTTVGLITVNDNWSAVPGAVGFLGQDMTTSTGADPQTLLTDSALANDLDVIANQSNPAITNGGVAEFDGIANPTIALQGSGTADAPHVLLSLNTTGLAHVSVGYTLRDIDGSADNATQPVALQYRVGGSGTWTNVPAAFVADATSGPSLATLVTPINVSLPAAVDNQALVQLRIITTNAVGSDEWVGVDDISVTASAADQAPVVQGTTPANSAVDVPIGASVSITFSEQVNVAGVWFTISCANSGPHTAGVSGGPATFTLNPDVDFDFSEICTVTVLWANVTDQDADDPPDALAGDYVFGFTTGAAPPPPPTPGSVVISEIYGGGGNAGATLKNDFIELYNRSAGPISLAGWSVQYASATGTGAWLVTSLTGSIPAGRNYLVREAAGAAGTVDLPTPDAIGSIAMSATAGKVALVSSITPLTGACPTDGAIIDILGYGATANCFEGGGPAPAPSNTTSDLRNGGGATDTDNNAADFTAGVPGPYPSADQAPAVSVTLPANSATGIALAANVAISFNEAVSVTSAWFTMDCATSGVHAASVTGGPISFTLDPLVNFAPSDLCTVTVLAANVTDQDAEDPPDAMVSNYVFTFTTADVLVCAAPSTRIHDIQGSGLASPMAGAGVTIEAVVIGDYQAAGGFGGYYLQDEAGDADADPATSEGIFVYANGFGPDVNRGDVVRVRGTVAESFGLTELNPISGVEVCSTGVSVTPTVVSLPVASLDDLERFEGMLVEFTQTLTATEVFNLGRFGEVILSGVGRLYTPTALATPGAAALAQLDQNNRSRIILDDGDNQQNIDPTVHPLGGLSASNTLRVGDTLPGLTGVMDYRFSNYRIQPVGPISFDQVNLRTAAPANVGGSLKVASFNVLNFFNGDGLGGGFPTARGANTLFELGRQKTKEVSALQAMNADIVGLMEIENDAPPSSAIEELVSALNGAMGAGTYAFVDTGVIGTDAIKVALIYKPVVVTPVGSWQILTTATDPRFIDTLNRPSLAQTFEVNATGERLTVVVNHLKSKGSDCNAVADPDTGDGQGNCNVTRTNAAAALIDWLATDPTGSGDPDYLLIGDLNSYRFEDPITTLVAAGFTNLIAQFGGDTPYSYVFNGESGYLDHGLASSSLAAQTTGATDWHINADEPRVLDYNVEFKTANQVNTFYDSGPYRSSDHDPVVIGLALDATAPETVIDTAPVSPTNNTAATIAFSGADTGTGVASLECALDLAPFGTCASPASYAALADGSHTFTVRAVDAVGNVDATPATALWVVDATAPDTAIDTAPGSPTESALATFQFHGSDTGVGLAGFACSLDGAALVTCVSPVSYAALADGSHTFAVWAVDAVGNQDPTPAAHTWAVVQSARSLKTRALASLLPYVRESRRIGKAILAISASLSQHYWIDAGHLDARRGVEVFTLEKHAVQELEEVLKLRRAPGDDCRFDRDRERRHVGDRDEEEDDGYRVDRDHRVLSAAARAAVRSAAADLMAADGLLTATAIADARATPVRNPKNRAAVARDIANAEEDVDRAKDLATRGWEAQAIGRYRDAWRHAQAALKKALDR
jgi:predicted extracellular nuclease